MDLEENENEYRKAQHQLMNECEDIWKKVEKNSETLNESMSPKSADSKNPSLSICQSMIERLQAEIEELKTKKPAVLPTDPLTIYEVLESDMKRTNQELEEVKVMLQAEKESIKGDLERERKYHKQHIEITAALESKVREIEETQQNQLDNMTENSVVADLNKKKKEIDKFCDETLREMISFMNKNFHLPTKDEVDTAQKSALASKADRDQAKKIEYFSLQSIVQDLMNKCLESPQQPYIEIDERHWQPYIEMLLRSNMILRNPDNENLIKLTPFHL